jgi:site-specific DNA-cytosine methylase
MNMMNGKQHLSDITWAPIIPLIGGQMIGAEEAFGTSPKAIYSYPDFKSNDKHYVNYQNNVKSRAIPYIMVEDALADNIDVISGTPPCAGLSSQNMGKTEDVKGASSTTNQWIYNIFNEGINKFNAKAIVVENAPALFTPKGQDVANHLLGLCENSGYSLSLYKTSTKYHGIPQARDRTFAIAWQSETCPIMGWYKRPRKTFGQYLNQLDDSVMQMQDILNDDLTNEPYYAYVASTTNKNAREVISQSGAVTAWKHVLKTDQLHKSNKWFHETGHEEGIRLSDHAVKKLSSGGNVWDGSVRVFEDCMHTVMHRNIKTTIHPKFNRSLSIREAMHMMGLPNDFELLGGMPKLNHIAQNVPVTTSRDIHLEVAKFIRGELPMTETNFYRQDNQHEKSYHDPNGKTIKSTLEAFF